MAEEAKEDRNLQLEQVKLCFEANKHLSTLSVAVLVFGVVAEEAGLEVEVGLALIFFGICLGFSLASLLYCISIASLVGQDVLIRHGIRYLFWALAVSLLMFSLGTGVVVFLPVIYPVIFV